MERAPPERADGRRTAAIGAQECFRGEWSGMTAPRIHGSAPARGAAIDVGFPPSHKAGRLTNNPRLRRSQHIHSAVVTLAGLSGIAAAIWLAWFVKPIS